MTTVAFDVSMDGAGRLSHDVIVTSILSTLSSADVIACRVDGMARSAHERHTPFVGTILASWLFPFNNPSSHQSGYMNMWILVDNLRCQIAYSFHVLLPSTTFRVATGLLDLERK